MNLLKIGTFYINLDQITYVRDNGPKVPKQADSLASFKPHHEQHEQPEIIVYFTDGSLELSGNEAALFRSWLVANNINPTPSELP